jgi:hypothetical protein
MTPEQIEAMLAAEESETLERKESIKLTEKIRDSIVAFANDLYGHERAWLIVGQADDRQIVGLTVSDDEASKILSDIARNSCRPAIPVSVEFYTKDSKRLAIVEVRRSPARPHFTGKALARMGSTNRQATDPEIILLRAIEENRKIATLKRWLDEGETSILFWQIPSPIEDPLRSRHSREMTLVAVAEDWIVVDVEGTKQSFGYNEFELGYDAQNNRPQIRYHGAR